MEPSVTFTLSDLSEQAKDDVRLSFNPNGYEDVQRIKMLGAAYLTEIGKIVERNPDAAREAAVARTNFQTAAMWATLSATKGRK